MAYQPFDPNLGGQQNTANPFYAEQLKRQALEKAGQDAAAQIANPGSNNPNVGYTPASANMGWGGAAAAAIHAQDKTLGQSPAANPEYNSPYSGPGQTSMGATTLGGNPYMPFGDPARATNDQLQMQAYGAAQRGPSTANMGGVNMFATGAGNSLGQANNTNLLGVRQGLDMASLANGPGVAAQYRSANELRDLAQMPTGPSVAQQQLQMGGESAMRQQMAMAAGARGGNAGLAQMNAGANAGAAMAQLNGQMGVQRAQEDMANRQFSANATQAAGGMYGQALQSQGNALGGAANIFQGVAGSQVAQAGAQSQLAGIYGNLSQADLNAAMEQKRLNDATMLGSQGMGLDVLNQQRAAEMSAAQQNAQNANTRYGIDKGALTAANALSAQKDANNNALVKDYVGAGVGALGALATPVTGGASIPAAAAAVPAINKGIDELTPATPTNPYSDVRAKKDIQPASADVSDAFRAAGDAANTINSTNSPYPMSVGRMPDAPAYSYAYKNPSLPGTRGGTNYGPMAQDLEKTPAGASVVVQKPNGMKGIDTSRLSLLNTSELSKQRAELDALTAKLNGDAQYIQNAYIPKPMGGAANMHLNQQLAPRVPSGAARPFAPGEYVDNPDGSWSSERSMTVQNPNGSWSVIPSVWLKNNKPYEAASEGEAQRLAQKSGLQFQRFPNLKTADQYSVDREAAWQPIQNPADASSIPPLYKQPYMMGM